MARRHRQDVTEENNHFFKIPRREKRIKTGKEARVDRRTVQKDHSDVDDDQHFGKGPHHRNHKYKAPRKAHRRKCHSRAGYNVRHYRRPRHHQKDDGQTPQLLHPYRYATSNDNDYYAPLWRTGHRYHTYRDSDAYVSRRTNDYNYYGYRDDYAYAPPRTPNRRYDIYGDNYHYAPSRHTPPNYGHRDGNYHSYVPHPIPPLDYAFVAPSYTHRFFRRLSPNYYLHRNHPSYIIPTKPRRQPVRGVFLRFWTRSY